MTKRKLNRWNIILVKISRSMVISHHISVTVSSPWVAYDESIITCTSACIDLPVMFKGSRVLGSIRPSVHTLSMILIGHKLSLSGQGKGTRTCYATAKKSPLVHDRTSYILCMIKYKRKALQNKWIWTNANLFGMH